MIQDFSWGCVMRYCYSVLGIPPSQFWNMTMLEIIEITKDYSVDRPITKADLEYMINNFH